MSLILKDILAEASQQEIQKTKEVRDSSVADELSSYLESQIPFMKKKEELFDHYLNVLDDVYKSSNNKPEASDLSALNEFWGMWLLTSFSAKDSNEELKSRLKTDLDTARQKLRLRESPSSNLYHYISFGNDLREKGKIAESINMYTKAIQKDHCWGAIAYYNRAFTSLKHQDRRQSPDCINRALEDLQNALKSVQLLCDQLQVTHRFLKQHSKVKVEETPVYALVSLVHSVPLKMFSMESLRALLSRDPLKCSQLIRDPAFDIPNELESLKSLGLTHIYTLDTVFSLVGFISKIRRSIMSCLFGSMFGNKRKQRNK